MTKPDWPKDAAGSPIPMGKLPQQKQKEILRYAIGRLVQELPKAFPFIERVEVHVLVDENDAEAPLPAFTPQQMI